MTRLISSLAVLLLLVSTAPADIEPEPTLPPVDAIPARPRARADDNDVVRYILKYVVKAEPHQSFEELDPGGSVLMLLGNTTILDDRASRPVPGSCSRAARSSLPPSMTRESRGTRARHSSRGWRVGENERCRRRLSRPTRLPAHPGVQHVVFDLPGVGKIATNQAGRVGRRRKRAMRLPLSRELPA